MLSTGEWKKGETADSIVVNKPFKNVSHDKAHFRHYGGYCVAESMTEENRELAIAAVNTFKGIKPDNPIAVTYIINEMFAILKALAEVDPCDTTKIDKLKALASIISNSVEQEEDEPERYLGVSYALSIAYYALTNGMEDIPSEMRRPECARIRIEARRLLRKALLTEKE